MNTNDYIAGGRVGDWLGLITPLGLYRNGSVSAYLSLYWTARSTH